MIWLTLLKKLWPYIAGIALILGAAWYFHHTGYVSGRADELAVWKPRFDAAERELAAANARTEKAEALSSQAVARSQERIDETLKNLHARTVDYDGRLRSLSVRLAAAGAHRCEVSPLPRSSPELAGPTESEQRAAAAGSRIAIIGGDCEADSARLAEWQRWYTEQRAIFESAGTNP